MAMAEEAFNSFLFDTLLQPALYQLMYIAFNSFLFDTEIMSVTLIRYYKETFNSFLFDTG